MRTIRNNLILKGMMAEIEDPIEDRSARPLSPCTLICTLDDDKCCLGCGRTLAQISGWALMSATEQWTVIDELDAQSPPNDATIAAEIEDCRPTGNNVDVNARIEEQLKSHNVLLYMKGTPDFPQCGFSGQTIAALNAIGKPYSYVNIFEDQEVREGLKVYSNWPTFPQLYVKGELIGGCDIVIDMYHSGELKELIESESK
jgi:monothiol glutaredoxin